MSGDLFVFAPVEVFQDRRLSLIQLRVLLALFSFRAKNSDVVFPKRSALSERCGYDKQVISRTTTELVKLGWLDKCGDGGRSAPARYKILCPDFAAKTVTDQVTVTGSVTVTDPVTKTVTDPVTRKELTNELTNIYNNNAREDILTDSEKPNSLATAQKPTKKRKAVIEGDWQPSDRCFELIDKAGIDRAFAVALIDEFVLYWQDRQEMRHGWDATFLNHAKARNEKQKSRNDLGGNGSGLPSRNNQGGGHYAGKSRISETDWWSTDF